MNRQLKFDLEVNPNALLCPNPQEFYSKCYITEDVVDNFRTIPGVKSATKIANVVFTDLLAPANCGFTAGTAPLDAKDIDVCSLSAMAEICRFDLESSFVSLQMAKGSNGNWTVPSFMAYYWDEMANEIQEEVAILRWQGDTTGGSGTYLDLCDGYNVQFDSDGDIIPVAAAVGGVDVSNVLAEMDKVYNALPAACKFKTSALRFFVSANVASAYLLAAAQGNTQTYVTQALPLTYLGIKVVVQEGMANDTMVLTVKDNLIYAFDGEDDGKALKAINLEDTVAEPVLRTRTNLKVGFHYVNPFQIVYYS